MNRNQLIIFDTTLRDGEQSPGAAMTKEEKVRVARQLERLGVDVIEAGFAAASAGDFDAISTIAGIVKDSTICSLARANEKDIRRAGEDLHAGQVALAAGRQIRPAELSVQIPRDRVLQAAYAAAKRVRSETTIGERPTSMASAAVAVARVLAPTTPCPIVYCAVR